MIILLDHDDNYIPKPQRFVGRSIRENEFPAYHYYFFMGSQQARRSPHPFMAPLDGNNGSPHKEMGVSWREANSYCSIDSILIWGKMEYQPTK